MYRMGYIRDWHEYFGCGQRRAVCTGGCSGLGFGSKWKPGVVRKFLFWHLSAKLDYTLATSTQHVSMAKDSDEILCIKATCYESQRDRDAAVVELKAKYRAELRRSCWARIT